MSYKSGFFDAIDQGDGDYDREYIAADFSHYFSLFIANGVFPDPSTNLQVKASAVPDMHVSVQPGSGWVNGYYITVPEESSELLTIPTANPTLSRIDSVIMGLNYVNREIQLYVKSGAVSSNPTPVELQRDTDLYELELCQVTVKAGAASITQSSIKDTRQDASRCGIVKGTIDQIDTTDLFAQYDAAFQEWFEDVKSQLEGDVATNLLNRIIQLEQKVEENWNNTASSETKAVYGLSEETTPDEVFQAVFAVGDIKASVRTDLGSHWILCNGESADRKEYPELYSILPKSQSIWDKTTYNFYTTLPLQVDRYLIDMNYNEGQYRYLDVVNKTLSKMITAPAITSTSTKMYFIDGLFVYCGFIGESYYTSRDLSGNWVKRKYYPDYINTNAAMKFLQKAGDKYIAIFDEENYSRRWIGITDNLETGTWTAYKLTDISGVVESFFCVDNHWVYTFRNSNTYRVFYYEGETPPDDPSQWNAVMNSQIYRIKKIAGVYYLSGYNATHPYGFYKNNILDFENFGELVLQNITDFVNLGTTIVGYYSSKTGFSKVLGELVCKTEQGAGSLTQFFTYGKKLYACGYVDQNPAGERTVVLEVDEEHLEWALLPTISFDKAYAYIRGK